MPATSSSAPSTPVPSFQRARVERQPTQYLYNESDLFYFMNKESYEQIAMNRDAVGDMVLYLKENDDCQVLTYGEEAINVELPAAVILDVAETEPALRGDTAQGGTKPATLVTGLVVNVPFFRRHRRQGQSRHAQRRVPRARQLGLAPGARTNDESRPT